MPGAVADTPAVSLSFANNFWGKDDAGVGPMLERMHNAKVTCDELKAFYNTRAAIEDEYARKLLALCRKPLGSSETGTLRQSLDSVRGETDAIGKTHAAIAAQMKSELEEPLAAFSGGMKERRKIVQNGIEKILKAKIQQTHAVNKSRDRYEQDCLRIKGYLAQGHMVMGQEERKNKAKLEKTQIQLASNSSEYEAAVKVLEETTGRWNKEWKAACDKFQDLEEERLDFMKSSLWNYANIASTACVSDDASCEKIRVSLEGCEVEKDIKLFITERGTGQEIPDPPKYINFCRGDFNDTSSQTSEEDSYSVAQFQRTINPAYRSSSPQPSTYESHHDPQSELAMRLGKADPPASSSREATVTPQKPPPQAAPVDTRRGQQLPPNYHPNHHGEIPSVPHNAYPTDGMTMFCRTGGPASDRGSASSINRPSSRDSRSEVSNATSMSSVEPARGQRSPLKSSSVVSAPVAAAPAQNQQDVQKKRSSFFSNSPFRRKSKHEKEKPQSSSASGTHRNTWSMSKPRTPSKPAFDSRSIRGASPEPVDPRANFQLNVGNNVFDVASPDAAKKPSNGHKSEELDPIAQALADLKVVGNQAPGRVSADRYHGISTPAPSAAGQSDSTVASALRGTPPPAYGDGPVKRLDAPQPAFTSAQMQKTTRKYVGQTKEMFNSNNASRPAQRPNTLSQSVPRATSPAPRRSASPQPPPSREQPHEARYSNGGNTRPSSSYQTGSINSTYRQSPAATPTKSVREASYSPQYSRHNSPSERQSASPHPQFRRAERPASATGMELQLSSSQVDPFYAQPGGGGGGYNSPQQRPLSLYHGHGGGQDGGQGPRTRSRSVAVVDGRQFSRDGRPILHFARAMYSYTAAIPEELGFTKGDVLAVLRHQDDGWWEAEITGQGTPPGLVPSNYLSRC